MTITFDEDKQKRKIGDLLHQEEEDLVQTLSGKYNVDYVNLLTVSINTDALRLIDEQTSRNALVAAYALIDKKVKVAARNPADSKTGTVLEDLKQKGFGFVGPTICYAFMQAVGMVNDHVVGCFRHDEVKKAAQSSRKK